MIETLPHLTPRKPRMALLGVYIDKYDVAFPGYREKGRAFMRSIADALGCEAESVLLELASNPEEVARHVKAAEEAVADALLLISYGYVNSLIAADALCATPLPLIFFNTQEVEVLTTAFDFNGMRENHGMQGVQDLAAVLVRRGRHFGIVTGTVRQEDTRALLLDHLIAARAAHNLAGRNIGTFGPVMAGMGDAAVERAQLTAWLGLRTVDLDPAELARLAAETDASELAAAMAWNQRHFELAADVGEADHARSTRLYIAMRQLCLREKLAGMTFSFDRILGAPGIETIPFLGITRLMGEGVAYGGEGDLFTTALGTLAGELGGPFSFTEMYTMDFLNNKILHTHMAECSPAMARRDRRPRLLRRQFTLAACEPFCALTFSIEPGPVTMVAHNILPDGRLHLIALEADVLDIPPLAGFDIPNFFVGYERDLRAVVDEYSLLGGPHHLNMVFGRHARRFEAFARLRNMEFSLIETE